MLFTKPLDINKSFIVQYAPIFSELKRGEKNLILKKSEVKHYKKDSIVYRQDDPADAFYCVISGRVKISRIKDNKEEILEFVTSGMYFGIISLLTTKTHSVSAKAVNDSLILYIKKDDFNFILKNIPKLAIDLSKTLSLQMRSRDYARSRPKSNILSIYSAISGIGRTMYATNLALSLRRETKKKIILLEISQSGREMLNTLNIKDTRQPIDLRHSILTKDDINKFIIKGSELEIDFLNILHNPKDANLIEQVSPLLSLLTDDYQYVIVDLPVEKSKFVFKILTQSDNIHLITDYNIANLKSTRELMVSLFESVEYPQEKIKVILNERKDSKKIPYDEIIKLIDHDVFAAIPVFWEARKKIDTESVKIILTKPDCEYAKAIRRIAREVGDCLVGLALGSGAALGLSHIGVIKVLERENIHIDVVAGASMGALIGAFWAAGNSGSQIENIMMEYNNKKGKVFRLLGDLCLPKTSFAQGKRITKFLKRHLGNKTFQDVRFPLKVLACHLDKREKIVIDNGSLVDAVRASIAIPGMFRPMGWQDNLIVDGGILEPVPCETLAQAGVKKIIAVNVLPSPEDVQEGYKNYKYYLEKEKAEIQKRNIFVRFFYLSRHLMRKMFFPNIFDIMINSILGMEYVMAKENCKKADVLISPVIAGTNWFEFFRVEELVKKGEIEAEKAIARIKDCIKEVVR